MHWIISEYLDKHLPELHASSSSDCHQRGKKCNAEGVGPLGEAVLREQSSVGDGLLCQCPAVSTAHNRAVFRTTDSRSPAHRQMHWMRRTCADKGWTCYVLHKMRRYRCNAFFPWICGIWGTVAPNGIGKKVSCSLKSGPWDRPGQFAEV